MKEKERDLMVQAINQALVEADKRLKKLKQELDQLTKEEEKENE